MWFRPKETRRTGAQPPAAPARLGLNEIVSVHVAREKQRMDETRAKNARRRHQDWNDFLQFCRLATPEDYVEWLTGYVATHNPSLDNFYFFDEDLGSAHTTDTRLRIKDLMQPCKEGSPYLVHLGRVHVLQAQPKAMPDPDSNIFDVIVPSGLILPPSIMEDARKQGLNLFFMDGFTATREEHIPIFRDVAALVLG